VRRLVLGIGNTIMRDDGVGIYVVRMIKGAIRSSPDLQFKELGVSGFNLVEEILGYDEVTIIDSYASTEANTGRIRELTPEDFEDTVHASSPHGANFATALAVYRKLKPTRMPRKIRIFTIDIEPADGFGEGLSNPVRDAAVRLAEMIGREFGADRMAPLSR
jgi:hydrogenase maturation protease